MTTAVVTIVHGRHQHLRNQLRGVARSARAPDMHIVVALDDRTVAAVVAEQRSPAGVVDLRAGHPLPLARARNAGAATALHAGATLLIFLDVDCIPGPELIGRYVAAAQQSEHANALLCGPVTYLDQPTGGDYDIARLESAIRPHPDRPAPPDGRIVPTADYDLFWSLSFALPARSWEAVGGFCEQYRGYGGEDTDFARCIRSRGIPMRWVGGAHAFHQHHPVHDPPIEHLDDILRNAAIFHRRWGSWPMSGWLNAFQDLGLIRRDPDGAPIRTSPPTT